VQIEIQKSGGIHFEKEPVRAHLDTLEYPLHHLDFETIGYAVPKYDGTHSYQHLPFQYSLHRQSKPGAKAVHSEFLHPKDTDPREALVKKLLSEIGDKGSVVVYHASFERSILQGLAERFPKYKHKLLNISDRLWDLEVPFAKKWYYTPEMEGRSSLKKVLPALIPDMDYENMDVSSGDQATMEYHRMLKEKDGKNRDEIRAKLLKYCQLDTLSMVKILEFLEKQYE